MIDPVAARDASLRFVTGDAAVLTDDDENDEAIEEHPFFDGLKAPPKEDEWDAETILTTYTTAENHPTTIKMARRPRRGDETIQLDRRTGLPVGTVLPATEERLRREAELVGGGEEDYGDDMSEFGRHEGVNLGVARPKKEAADDKRERKAAAKAAKSARRQEKKGTKEAFRTERTEQLEIRRKTVQVPMQSLSRFPGQ